MMPPEVRALLDGPNYAHLSTLRAGYAFLTVTVPVATPSS